LMLATLAARPLCAFEELDRFPSSTLTIRTQRTTEWFSVWIADTPERSQQGLMYQPWLPPDHGMLFLQDAPRVPHMWMKNTLIPLDMLFIDTQGKVVYIRERTTPQSLDLISSPTPVKAVLELAGGACAALGIKVGDRVRQRAFGTAPQGPVAQ